MIHQKFKSYSCSQVGYVTADSLMPNMSTFDLRIKVNLKFWIRLLLGKTFHWRKIFLWEFEALTFTLRVQVYMLSQLSRKAQSYKCRPSNDYYYYLVTLIYGSVETYIIEPKQTKKNNSLRYQFFDVRVCACERNMKFYVLVYIIVKDIVCFLFVYFSFFFSCYCRNELLV